MRASVYAPILLFAGLANCVWKQVYNDDPTVQCYGKQHLGKYKCCCYDSKCGGSGWGQPCGGDLDDTCSADELHGPGLGDGFNSTIIELDKCPQPPGCNREQYSYTWKCCKPPAKGNWKPYHLNGEVNPYCPSAPFFVGCTEPNEVLTDDGNSCKNTTCPSIDALKSPNLKYHQAVVNDNFKSTMDALVACAKEMGPKSALSIQSTSRCGKSPKDSADLATKGFSLHQIGMAVDTNLIINGVGCNRTCMAHGWCAYHQDSPSCQNSNSCEGCEGQKKTPQNQLIEKFFECAQDIPGLEVGATFKKGDWNHFEKDVPDRDAAASNFVPQLKAFCNNRCPGKKKTNPGDTICNCPGFH